MKKLHKKLKFAFNNLVQRIVKKSFAESVVEDARSQLRTLSRKKKP